jgi:hypothetical protein
LRCGPPVSGAEDDTGPTYRRHPSTCLPPVAVILHACDKTTGRRRASLFLTPPPSSPVVAVRRQDERGCRRRDCRAGRRLLPPLCDGALSVSSASLPLHSRSQVPLCLSDGAKPSTTSSPPRWAAAAVPLPGVAEPDLFVTGDTFFPVAS